MQSFSCFFATYFYRKCKTISNIGLHFLMFFHKLIIISLSHYYSSQSLSCLKLASAIFYQIFIFHQMIALENYEKCFSFHQKISFRSRDIQIFVFLSSRPFLPVSHCFGGCLKINLKVYDVIDCLNKNLITHFV